LDFVGGEDAGLKRLTDYIESGALQTYKETRNGLLGKDASSKFSPWFAQGSLSVVKVMNTVLQQTQNASTAHFVDELFWRDFFIQYAYHHQGALFYEYGVTGKGPHNWEIDHQVIQRWKDGMTGMPLIDACMRELKQTGWMSNRGR